jgi:predicted dehydrogenase
MNDVINVGLVGFGFAGKVFHAPVIRATEGMRLAAIVQRTGMPDPRYSDIEFVRGVDDLLQRDIDLVVVATPNTSHYPIAKQSLLAGRHVVVDKPFTTTVEEAEELVQIAKKNKRVLSAYQNRRFVGDFQTLQLLLRDDAVGRVTIFESHFDRFRPQLKPGAWREQAEPGSGVWYDLGTHLLDQALVLFGIPESITADIRIERDGAATDDAFDVTLNYPKMRAMLRATMLAAYPGPTFAVHGTEGSFIKYGLDPQEDALKAGGTPNDPEWGSEPPEAYGRLATLAGVRAIPTLPGNFRQYYENIRDAIRGRAELTVTPEQAVNVMRGLELAVESSRQRTTLPWSSGK